MTIIERPIRSLLFVPGNRNDMLAKAVRYPAHAFIPDLEDSVPPGEKDSARGAVAAAIPVLADTGRPVIPRLNSLETGLLEGDLEAVARPRIAGVSVGKLRRPEDIARVVERIDDVERKKGLAPGSISLLPWIETAEAVARALEICRASGRISMVAFGAEDLSVDMGLGSPSGPLMLHARSAVAIAARAAGIPAYDTPYARFRDEPGLGREATLARQLGFAGKFAIHPAQIETIHRVFRPGEAEIERARAVVDAWEAGARDGRGSVAMDGEMIDAPVAARARAVLREAEVA